MKVNTYDFPKSRFLSVDKDIDLIMNKIISNERIKKLIYYTTPDCLTLPNVTPEQSVEILQSNLRRIPQLKIDETVKNYIFIKFDGFVTNMTNPEYRDNIIEFDIICHLEQWDLENGQQRPYRIAGEIDSMFNKSRLSGIGTLDFVSCELLPSLGSPFAGLCIKYAAIHGHEDMKYND